MNTPQLEPTSRAGELALAIYARTLQNVRAEELTRRCLHLEGDTLRADSVTIDVSRYRRILVTGAGKAAVGMARGVHEVLQTRVTAGVAVTKYGSAGQAGPIDVLEAAHPVPDTASVDGGRAVHALASGACADDLVIALISGGASAVMELPAEGITLGDLRRTTDLLLRGGAPITELNAVRACLSDLKAGGLARAAAPADVLCLVLSDVLGNPLTVIGSGPCCDVDVDPEAARQVLLKHNLWDTVPSSVRDRLSVELPVTPHGTGQVWHVLIGDIWTALDAAHAAAHDLGLNPLAVTGWMQGEASEVAQLLAGMARDLAARKPGGYDCFLIGGETTVTVRGRGRGGRSQEIAAVAAGLLDGIGGVALLAGGTDGSDGPTDAAGGLVDGATAARAREAGVSLSDALRDSSTYDYLEAAGALLKTGPTHSNLGDLVFMVAAEGPPARAAA